MTQWDRLPSTFQFTVQDAPQKDVVKVFKGRLPGSGRPVQVAPFTKANMDKIAQIMARLRTQKQPAIEYITNQFIDIHRSSGKSHVVGAIMTNEEVQGTPFELDVAGKQGLANKMANCDRVNAIANRMLTLFDIKDPILYYWTTEGNHNTCLVGDPRMSKYGEKNTVVMDAYSVFPMPHTLAEASYQVRIPQECEEGHADLEIWHPQKNPANRFDASHLPAPLSDQQQTDWLKERGWPPVFGPDVVKAWHDTELRETGKAPDRWEYLFSCKDPSVQYHTGKGDYTAYNAFPLAYVQQRTEAFLQLHQAYAENAFHSQNIEPEVARLPGRRSARLMGEPQALPIARDTLVPDTAPSSTTPASGNILPRPELSMAFQHSTPLDTIVTDLHTGEVLMEMHGTQIPVDKVNHGFPIKDPQKPWAIHPDYVSPTDPFRCHENVKIGRVEFPRETREIMQKYFPAATAEPNYFDNRAAEVKAEYEAPLPPNYATPPSATQWRPKRLTADECYGAAQAKALEGTFGVIPVDYKEQNVGGMGPAFAGAEIKTAAQRRQYIRQISKAAFDDFSMRAGNPKTPAELARFAPYGGGNLAQFMNGKMLPGEQAHFIAVDVIAHTTNKYGEPRRVVAPHLFQIAEVPAGKQAILDYGDDGGYFYGGNRPGMASDSQGTSGIHVEVKSEPLADSDIPMDEVPMREEITPSTFALRHKRPRQGAGALEPKRRQMAARPRDSVPHGAAAAPDSSRRSTRTSSATALMARLQRQQSPAAGLESDTPMPDQASIDPAGNETDSLLHAAGDSRLRQSPSLSSLSSVPDDSDFEYGEKESLHSSKKEQGHRTHAEVVPGYDNARASSSAQTLIPTQNPTTAADRLTLAKDKSFVQQLPIDVWLEATTRAQQNTLPAGVREDVHSNGNKVYRAKLGNSLGSFSVLPGQRDEQTAKALAIAKRLEAERNQPTQRTDAAVIEQLPNGIWNEAIRLAQQETLPTGVFESIKKGGSKIYQANNGRIVLGVFSVTDSRDEQTAKALAIAKRLQAVPNQPVLRTDASVIDQLPVGVWDEAMRLAQQSTLPPGVRVKHRSDGNKMYRAFIEKNTALGAFSVTAQRDEQTAKALAIAKRLEAERNRPAQRTDAAVIEQLPHGVWDDAMRLAQQSVLPTGVSLETTASGSLGYRVTSGKKYLGLFSVTGQRDELRAKALAIAKRLEAEQSQPPQ